MLSSPDVLLASASMAAAAATGARTAGSATEVAAPKKLLIQVCAVSALTAATALANEGCRPIGAIPASVGKS